MLVSDEGGRGKLVRLISRDPVRESARGDI